MIVSRFFAKINLLTLFFARTQIFVIHQFKRKKNTLTPLENLNGLHFYLQIVNSPRQHFNRKFGWMKSLFFSWTCFEFNEVTVNALENFFSHNSMSLFRRQRLDSFPNFSELICDKICSNNINNVHVHAKFI